MQDKAPPAIPTISYDGPPELKEAWEAFVARYLQDPDSHNTRIIQLEALNRLAFQIPGDCSLTHDPVARAAQVRQALTEFVAGRKGGALETLRDDLRLPIEDNAAQSLSSPLNKAIVSNLGRLWADLEVAENIEALSNNSHVRSTKAWADHEKLAASDIGGILQVALLAASDGILKAQSRAAAGRLRSAGVSAEDAYPYAYDIMKETTFRYVPGDGSFFTYLTSRLKYKLVRAVARDLDGTFSMDSEYGDDDQFKDIVADKKAEDPLAKAILGDDWQLIIGLLETKLDDRERKILRLRFGLEDDMPAQTLEQISDLIGVTKERVRQIEAKALQKLRTAVTEAKHTPPASKPKVTVNKPPKPPVSLTHPDITDTLPPPPVKPSIDEAALRAFITGLYETDEALLAGLSAHPPGTPYHAAALALASIGLPKPPYPDTYETPPPHIEAGYLCSMLTSPDSMIPHIRTNFSSHTRIGKLLAAIENPPELEAVRSVLEKKTVEMDGSMSFAKSIDVYTNAGGRDIHQFLRKYMETHNLSIPAFSKEIDNPENAALKPSPPVGYDYVRGWVTANRPTKINSFCRTALIKRYELSDVQQRKLELINGSIDILDTPQTIIAQAMVKQADALKPENAQKRAKLLDAIAFETYEKLLAASLTNPEKLGGEVSNANANLLRVWARNKRLSNNTLVRCVDEIAQKLVPGDEDGAKTAAIIMLGLPAGHVETFDKCAAYATEHKIKAPEFIDILRATQRKEIEKGWLAADKANTRDYDGVTAYQTFLIHDAAAKGMELTKGQIMGLRARKDAPVTEAVTQIAKSLGAATPAQQAFFRRVVFEHPLDAGQPQVDAVLDALEAAGTDKEKRRAVMPLMEKALKQRDGLRHKGRVDIATFALAHARAVDAVRPAGTEPLIPPEGAINEESLGTAMNTFNRNGGDVTLVKARIFAAYMFPDDEARRDRMTNALAPNRLVETAPGAGNRFTSAIQQRPGWSHDSSMVPRRRASGGGAGGSGGAGGGPGTPG